MAGRRKPGIFTIPAERYHADPCAEPSLSASIAQLICARSPRHAWAAHPRLNPDFERNHDGKWDIGTTAHAILLEQKPVEEIVEIVEAPDWRTGAAREARDAARASGRIPLLPHDVEDVVAMLAATKAQLEAIDDPIPFFDEGKSEQTLIWKDGVGDVYCRARLDFLRNDRRAIDDFKTTSASANPESWTRTLFTIGADVQTAFYLRGLKALTDVEARMRYIVQETYPPYALSVVELGPDVLAVGESKVEYALKRWRECLALGEWPGYASRIATAELPGYEDARWGEKLMREEVAA